MRHPATILAVFLGAGSAIAEPLDEVWTIAGHGVHVDADRLIGETQAIADDWVNEAFFLCDHFGQLASGVTHPMAAFLANPAPSGFEPAAELLRAADETAHVHRLTRSDATTAKNRRVLHPFVTTDAGGTAFHLGENAVFVLTWGGRS